MVHLRTIVNYRKSYETEAQIHCITSTFDWKKMMLPNQALNLTYIATFSYTFKWSADLTSLLIKSNNFVYIRRRDRHEDDM